MLKSSFSFASLPSFTSFASLALASSLLSVACGGSPDATEPNASANEDVRSSLYACHVDDDCVAIAAMGCCPDGSDVAVNKHKVQAYESSHVCTHQQICPNHIVLETRVAQCDNATKKCAMIQPGDIHCGGFIMNAHKCTAGFACELQGHVPDVGGTCKKSCVQTMMCMTNEHFDHVACACVAN